MQFRKNDVCPPNAQNLGRPLKSPNSGTCPTLSSPSGPGEPSRQSSRNVKHVALLGTATDKVIAARIGRTREAVLHHRKIGGIPRAPPVIAPAWTAEQDRLLGSMSDAEVAKRIGRGANAVTLHRQRLGIAKIDH